MARDSLTGFRGIVTARTEYLYGVPQVCIVPKQLQDGLPITGQWFEESRVVVEDEIERPGHFV
jgi:hypothetical protein